MYRKEIRYIGKVVGIDLGTTFSAIAHVNEHAQAEIIPNAESDRITLSVIMFEDDVITVGKIAKQNASAVPEDIVEFIKREIAIKTCLFLTSAVEHLTNRHEGFWI